MAYTKLPKVMFSGALVFALVQLMTPVSRPDMGIQSTAQPTVSEGPHCDSVLATTPATAVDDLATAPAPITPTGTMAATLTTTLAATQAGAAPIRYISFLPTDIRFNPTPDKPVVLIIVFSLIFENELADTLPIAAPHFQLAIDGVPWGMLSSTDFQTGQMPAHAQQGIVLQNLTFIAKTTPEQQAVLACLKAHQAVDLLLSGSLDAFPGGVRQSIAANVVTSQIVVREHQQVTVP